MPKKGTQSQVLTLALCWLFRKRSFAVSEDFKDLIQTSIGFSHQKLIQTNLREEEVPLKIIWAFIGVFSASKLGIDKDEWRKVITDKEVLSEILSF